jgi:hypothetical protein
MLSQVCMGTPLYPYTCQVGPRFGKSGSLVEWKWCHNVMFEADIHFRLLHTSILDICKVFETLVWYAVSRAYGCTLIQLHQPSCSQIWELRGGEMMQQRHGWGWYPPPTTSYIHIRHLHIIWAIGMLSQGCMGAPLYRYTGQVGPRFGKSGSLEEWKWCHNVMFEADIHFWLLHTSILDIYKVFETLVCCLKGIWVHPYTITPAKLLPDLGIQVHLRRGNDATTSWLMLISTSDLFIHPC